MTISMIVAVAKEGVIGLNGTIPWHVSEDWRYFKKVTMGKPVIMGRLTWDSLGRPLVGRENIVVSSTMDEDLDGATVVRNLEAALVASSGVSEVMIIGGSGLYDQGRQIADRIYLTEIDETYEGDTWFPTLDPSIWAEVSRRSPEDRKPGDPDYSFVIYERKPT